MLNKILKYLFLFYIAFYAIGCYANNYVTKDEAYKYADNKIFEVTTVNRETFNFAHNEKSKAVIGADTIKGTTIEGSYVEIPLKNVKSILVRKVQLLDTILFTAGVVQLTLSLLAVIWLGSLMHDFNGF